MRARTVRPALVLAIWIACAAVLHAADAVKPHVLLINDDGIDAPGIAALVDALAPAYRLTVAAPAVEQSGVSQAITYRTPVLVEDRPGREGVRRWAVHAQPATCARLALTALIAQDPPLVVLSGINRGANTGDAVWGSGTLGGAREAGLAGFPAIALSADHPRGAEPDWPAAGRWARAVLDQLLAAHLPARGRVVKVEIPFPAGTARGVRITGCGLTHPIEDGYVEKAGPADAEGRLFQARWVPASDDLPGTDTQELASGWVTVTPISLDQTDYRGLAALAAIAWTAPAPSAAP